MWTLGCQLRRLKTYRLFPTSMQMQQELWSVAAELVTGRMRSFKRSASVLDLKSLRNIKITCMFYVLPCALR